MSDSATQWSIDDTFVIKNRLKDFNRRFEREYAACFTNLARLVSLLEEHGGPKGFQIGFFRSEGRDVYRIGQTGVAHAHETRLYVYVDERAKALYLLTMGDKVTQQDDIRLCHRLADGLRKPPVGQPETTNEHAGEGGRDGGETG